MAPNNRPSQPEAIIQCYQKLDAECVGRRELEIIVNVLREQFGPSAPSPATVARTLADHGVLLSHPDVLEVDSEWRRERLSQIVPGDLETIEAAVSVVEKIQTLANSLYENSSDRLRFQVRQLQEELELIAQSHVGSMQSRSVTRELATWLKVWLQNPVVFEDWLSLRRNSPDFLQKFG
ncbi:MAG TPA: hypothetical protein VF251_14195 [Pyrinomonadaceae bacterium]